VDGLTGLFLPKTSAARAGENILSSLDLGVVSSEIQRSIQSLKDGYGGGGDVFLVIDQIDLLLAAGGDQIGAVKLGDMLVGLREVH
jgi:elongator complex protein 6